MTATLKIYRNNELINTLTSNSELEAVRMKSVLYDHYFRYKNNIGNYINVKISTLNDTTTGIFFVRI